jgi:hypothetical protein
MSDYRPLGVRVDVSNNPNLISLGGTKKIPAIVGLGPASRSYVDEPVIRQSGSVDTLATTGVISSVSRFANDVGVFDGAMHDDLISNNGALYALASASLPGGAQVQWSGSGVDVPTAGDVYYASYVSSLPSTHYEPEVMTEESAIVNKYSAADNYDGILTAAATLVLENGSPGVMVVQVEGDAGTFNETNYKNAIDKLEKKRDISYIIPVFPSGSVSRAEQETIISYLFTHVQKMNNIGKERGIMVGTPSGDFADGGFDAIGDVDTAQSYIGRANALKSENVTYVVPSEVWRGSVLYDSNLAAAAIAGAKAAKLKIATPVHGTVLSGITVEEEKWSDFEMNQLGGGSCTVIVQKSGVVSIRDGITTDPTSADTQEISVVDTKRLVKSTLRTKLEEAYTSKGLVIDESAPSNVEATTASILDLLIKDEEIAARGVIDDPLTGEKQIRAKQDPNEPRKILVTASYKPLYPLKWIDVAVNVYV